MESLSLEFEQLLIDIYRSRFDQALLKLDTFEYQHPGLATDPPLRQRVALLRAEAYAQSGNLQRALDLNQAVFAYCQPTDATYWPLALSIARQLSTLDPIRKANVFIESLLMPVNSVDQVDALTLVHLLSLYDLPNLEPFRRQITFVSEQLGLEAEPLTTPSALVALEQRVIHEGQALTRLLAETASESVKTAQDRLLTFLSEPKLSPFREAATNTLASLAESS